MAPTPSQSSGNEQWRLHLVCSKTSSGIFGLQLRLKAVINRSQLGNRVTLDAFYYSREGGRLIGNLHPIGRLTELLTVALVLHALPSSHGTLRARAPPPRDRAPSSSSQTRVRIPTPARLGPDDRHLHAARHRAGDLSLRDQAPSSSSRSGVHPDDRLIPRRPPVRQPLRRLDPHPRTDHGAACSDFQILRREAQNNAIISGRLRRMAGAPVLGSSHRPGGPAPVFQ